MNNKTRARRTPLLHGAPAATKSRNDATRGRVDRLQKQGEEGLEAARDEGGLARGQDCS